MVTAFRSTSNLFRKLDVGDALVGCAAGNLSGSLATRRPECAAVKGFFAGNSRGERLEIPAQTVSAASAALCFGLTALLGLVLGAQLDQAALGELLAHERTQSHDQQTKCGQQNPQPRHSHLIHLSPVNRYPAHR